MSFFNELKRRNVFKVAAAYIIVGWLIMQAGDTLAPALHLPEWINSALAFFLILGLPLALFFAWAYEMTPEGIKREKDVDRSQSITRVTGQKLNHTIIALLVITLGYFVYDKFIGQPRAPEHPVTVAEAVEAAPADDFQSIAVLPFVNMSEDSSNEYFSDGLTEEVLNVLAKIKDLRVAGRTSSFAFKGKAEDLREIGEKLDVTSILEGSVRKDEKNNRVRITAQLINVDDGYHLWSETYDRELDDIFAIQDEIARKVAEALRITLLGEDEARLEQVEITEISAYDAYLKAMQGLNEGGYVSLNRAAGQFQKALSLDPSYTPATLGLLNAWSQMAQTGSMTREEALRRGLPMLEATLAGHPENSDARVQLALFRVYQDENEAAEQAFVSALEANPRNAWGLQEYGRFLFDHGQVDRGSELIEAALEIEPYSTRVLWDHCQTNAFLQQVDIARASCNRIKELIPESPLGWYGEGLAYLYNGELARGLKGFSEAIERDPEDYEMLSAVCANWIGLGDAEQAAAWQTRAEAIGAGQLFPAWSRLKLLKFREQYDQVHDFAKQVLDSGMEDRHGRIANIRQDWAFESERRGDYQGALEPYRQALAWAFQTPLDAPDNVQAQFWDIAEIAALLKLAEPMSGRPEELLSIIEARIDDQHPSLGIWNADLSRAAIATIRGQHQEGLEWINKAWDKNWRLGWRETLVEDAIFNQLENEPGYKELVTRFEADMEKQRELAYELMGIKQ